MHIVSEPPSVRRQAAAGLNGASHRTPHATIDLAGKPPLVAIWTEMVIDLTRVSVNLLVAIVQGLWWLSVALFRAVFAQDGTRPDLPPLYRRAGALLRDLAVMLANAGMVTFELIGQSALLAARGFIALPRYWQLVILGFAAIPALQLIDHWITYGILMAGMGAAQVIKVLLRVFFFFREMGTFFMPLTVAVAITLLTPGSWLLARKHVRSAVLLTAVILAGLSCELAQRTFGKQRMDRAAVERSVELGLQHLGVNAASEYLKLRGIRLPGRDEVRNIMTKRHIAETGVPPANYRWMGGWDRGLRQSAYSSMPSSHTATATAWVVVLGVYFASLRPLCWVLAVGCGLSRIWTFDHYFSDVLAGALVGFTLAYLLTPWLTRQFTRLAEWLDARHNAQARMLAGELPATNGHAWASESASGRLV